MVRTRIAILSPVFSGPWRLDESGGFQGCVLDGRFLSIMPSQKTTATTNPKISKVSASKISLKLAAPEIQRSICSNQWVQAQCRGPLTQRAMAIALQRLGVLKHRSWVSEDARVGGTEIGFIGC